MSIVIEPIKYDHVPAIQMGYKVCKHSRSVSKVVVDGGVGVNIMSEQTRRSLGITKVKEAPFKVWMVDQRIVQPLGLVENIPIKARGMNFFVSFLIWDVGNYYNMLLGRLWLCITNALHDWRHTHPYSKE